MQPICKKGQKFVLIGNYFSDLFNEVQIWNWKNFKFSLWSFLERQSKFQSKDFLFLTIEAVNKDIKKQNKIFSGNPGHNILRLFDNWKNFPVTQNETNCLTRCRTI